jgi:hypothetical protein
LTGGGATEGLALRRLCDHAHLRVVRPIRPVSATRGSCQEAPPRDHHQRQSQCHHPKLPAGNERAAILAVMDTSHWSPWPGPLSDWRANYTLADDDLPELPVRFLAENRYFQLDTRPLFESGVERTCDGVAVSRSSPVSSCGPGAGRAGQRVLAASHGHGNPASDGDGDGDGDRDGQAFGRTTTAIADC